MATATKKQQTESKNPVPAAVEEKREMKQYDPADGGEKNIYEAYGDSASQRALVGTLVRFNKGDWLSGKDDDEIEVGTKFTAIMDQLEIGWMKWVDSKPESREMGKLSEGFRPPRRNALGDTDEAQWDVDNSGKPRDPWQYTQHLVMRTPGTTGEDDEDLFTFATSSRGGINAVGELCKVYGKQMRMRPDEWPVVEIGVDKYKHPNKEYGIIKVPTLSVVGWEPKVPAKKLAAPARRAAAR